jgi:oxygen-independent coproporphyrinogen-3 oxidase
MAGIYFHIPFCKQACHYCDFHFSTNFRNVDELIDAMQLELSMQKDYLKGEEVKTIYFGGGTPSSVPNRFIDELIQKVKLIHEVSAEAEISLEANPDDLIEENIQAWKKAGVNRLSVGVQSFYDSHLKWMNRAHNQHEAVTGLKLAKELGITNITMDLIYGIPNMTMNQWKQNLDTFFELDLPHLSAYGLTIESQTHLGHLVNTNQVKTEKDTKYNAQFEMLMEQTLVHGFDHYEISNFGKSGFYSRHNTSYWFGEKYIGIGPSAHSFNGTERQWNVASNMKYVKALNQNKLAVEVENLSVNDQCNEHILTRLRTQWGIDQNQIKTLFGAKFQNNLKSLIQPYLDSKHVLEIENSYILSKEGKYLADKISSDLFIVD